MHFNIIRRTRINNGYPTPSSVHELSSTTGMQFLPGIASNWMLVDRRRLGDGEAHVVPKSIPTIKRCGPLASPASPVAAVAAPPATGSVATAPSCISGHAPATLLIELNPGPLGAQERGWRGWREAGLDAGGVGGRTGKEIKGEGACRAGRGGACREASKFGRRHVGVSLTRASFPAWQ